jgi:hypothetical protein
MELTMKTIVKMVLILVTGFILTGCPDTTAPGPGIETVSAPVFTLVPGSYLDPVSIEIKCEQGLATIRYTTDGSTPTATTGTVYTGVIDHSEGTVMIKAIASLDGWEDSLVSTATYTIAEAVNDPVFSVTTGTFNDTFDLEITSPIVAAQIRYTTDGSEPSDSVGSIYSGVIPITTTGTVIKAICYKSGWNNSGVTSETYTLTASTPSISRAAGTYIDGTSTTASCATPGVTLRYSTSGTPTAGSPVLSGTYSVETSQTLRVKAFRTGFNSSGTASQAYTIKISTPVIVEEYGIKPQGRYVAGVTCPNGSATLRYTLDGTTPTASSPSTGGSVWVEHTATLKVRAFMTGCTASDTDSFYIPMTNSYVTVSGAGYSSFSVNGEYRRAGSYNGKDYWKHKTQDIYIYYSPGGPPLWHFGPDYTTATGAYYKNYSASNDFPPSENWVATGIGGVSIIVPDTLEYEVDPYF